MSTLATKPAAATTTIYEWPAPGEWTYADYARLPSDRRYEVIGGKLYMSPAPRPLHQEIVLAISYQLRQFVRQNKLGKVYIAPIDLILPNLATPVQPDILYIAQERLSMVQVNYIEGVPDLIVEVLSPGTIAHDRQTKFELYMKAGVTEYWLVNPMKRLVELFSQQDGVYVPYGRFEREAVVQSNCLPDLRLPLAEVWE